MSDPDEGMDWERAFDRSFGATAKVVSRLKDERTANQSPAERSRRGPPKKQRNFRCTRQTDALLDALTEQLGMHIGDVIELAIRQLAEAKGIRR
jgi:hypothetical protein